MTPSVRLSLPRRWRAPAGGALPWLVAVSGLVVLAVAWSVMWASLQGERLRIEREAYARVTGLAQAYEAHIQRTVRQMDQLTKFVAFNMAQPGATAQLDGLAKGGLISEPGVIGVYLADAHGDVVASSVPGPGANLADREHFRIHVNGRFFGLFISKPVLGRVSKRWVVQMSRRLVTDDGRFAGVVLVSVDPAYFTQFYSDSQFGQEGVVSLTGLDRVVRSRRSGDRLWHGDASVGADLDPQLVTQSTGTHAAASTVDGVHRLMGHKVLEGYPLVVITGLAAHEVFAAHDARARTWVAWVAVGTAALLPLIAWLTWLLWRLRRSQMDASASNDRTRAILEGAPDAFISMDTIGRVVEWNQQATRTFGWTREEVLGRLLPDFIVPEPQRAARAADIARLAAAAEGPALNRIEFEALRKDGACIPVEMSLATTRDVDGLRAMAFLRDISERRAAEELLKASEQRLRQVMDGIPAQVGYFDAEERCQMANEAALRSQGRHLGTSIGVKLRDILPAEDYANYRPAVASALAGKATRFAAHGTFFGRTVHYQAHLMPDRHADGSVRGFYLMAFDITALKVAEIQRMESERRLLAITDNLPALISQFDSDGRYVFANRHFKRLLGLDPERLIGQSLADAREEGYAARVAPWVQQVQDGHHVTFDTVMQLGDEEHHFQQNFVPDRERPNGPVRGFFSVTFDITDRIVQERQLAHSEKRLRDITDNLPVLIAYIDAQERYGFCNGTYRDWFGLDPAALVGHTVAETLSEGDYAARKAPLQRALGGERVAFDLATADGSRVLHTSYVPDVMPDGSTAGVYALSSDVTAMKAAEQRLAELVRTDALTGLPNRTGLHERLDAALARSRRTGRPLAVFFLDIDRFKAINDTFGHAVGDGVLQEFGRRIRAAIRTTDTVARLAGDEFVVVLEGVNSAEEPQFVARKLIAQMARAFDVDGHSLPVSTSVGIAYEVRSQTTAEALLGRADKALYVAKAAGRNCFRLEASAE